MASIRTTTTDGYPPECAAIKALFHQKAFRKCISTCRGLLKLNGDELDQRPLHKTFVLFYLALCHDEMARVMHHASVSKIPSFESAEQFYLDAMAALPTEDECRTVWEMRERRAQEDPFVDEESQSEWGASSSLADDDEEDSFFDDREVRSSAPHLAFISSPPSFRRDSFSARTQSSPQLSAADTDDLESHESFSELMTPNRVIKRDSARAVPPSGDVPAWKQPYSIPREYSRMSLVESASPPKVQGLPREYSRMSLVDATREPRPESRSLMRPVRLGSPPKRYVPPPVQISTSVPNRLSCKIPQIIKPLPMEDLTPRPPSPELVSPMSASPVRDSPVSVISVEYLPVQPRVDTPVFLQPEKPFDEEGLLRFIEHVAAMRIQLKTHVMLIHHAKRQLELLLESKSASRTPPLKGGAFPSTPPRKNIGGVFKTPSPPGQLQKTRSFWSFVPQDAKKAELQRRIQAGRERKWARKRFSPERYQNLCEVALEEL